MKINSIKIKALLGIAKATIEPGPVTIISGKNGAGKSSIAAAIRMALSGDIERITFKKDIKELAFNGATEYGAEVIINQEAYRCGNAFGKGKHERNIEGLDIVTSAKLLADMPLKELSETIVSASGYSLNPESVAQSLIQEGVDQSMVNYIMPFLQSGFESAETEAKNKARDEKTLWKSVTKEAWGAQKAETWEIELLEEDRLLQGDLMAQYDAAKQRNAELSKKLEAMNAQQAININQDRHLKIAEAKAAKLDEEISLLSKAEEDLAKHDINIADLTLRAEGTPAPTKYPCPCCNELLMFSNGDLKKWAHEGKPVDREAKEMLTNALKSRDVLVNQVNRHRKGVDDATAAKAVISEIKSQECLNIDFGTINEYIAENNELLAGLNQQLKGIESAIEHNNAAKDRQVHAQAHHQLIMQWLRVADLLSPTGIQLSITNKAIEKFNSYLIELCNAAALPLVQLRHDLVFTLNNRSYTLLSESEQWRVNTLAAIAYAEIREINFVLLDRFDVLDFESRKPFLRLFKMLTEELAIDSIMLFATLKECPSFPQPFKCLRVEKGEVVTYSGVEA